MKLEVYGSPVAKSTTNQTVVASYDEKTQLTTICCDTDIITLGIAATILNQKFEDYIKGVKDPKLADEIRSAVRKVCNEEH